MLTPVFELSQDEKFVYVLIKTPYIKISEVEYFIEECQFKFYVKPYFLRLNLPGKVVENGEESASYDVDKGIFTVHLPKLVPGSYFKDLDFLTKLLAPSGKSSISAPVIEVVSDDHASKNIEEDAQDFDWDWNQDIYDEEKECQLNLNGVKYGFGNQKSAVFYRLKDELKEIVENPNPDELSYSERHLAKIAAEDEKFDGEHYLADFFDDERIQEVLNYVVKKDKEVLLTEEEKAKLLQLPNREYLLDSKEEMSVFFSLVDIMFAYAYNKRTTLGENTVESAWTMSRLSSTLSWFERFTSLQDVFVACCRRSLSYPLYRHWELSCKVMEDVKEIFQLGRRKVLQCLLEILMLFNASEPRYILNELYITDYCIWIQKVKEIKVESLTEKLLKTNITKDDIGWELRDLELAALLVYDEQSNETESSSSEDSSETEDEPSSGDETDGENTNEELDISKKDPKVSPQVSLSVTLCDRGESFGGNLDSCSANKDFVATADEGISSEETLGGVEILPSLLFGKNRFGAKTFVEVIPEKSEARVSNEECTFNGDCESKHIESLGGDGAICENNKQTDVQQADTAVKERDLSGKMLDLSMKDNVE